MNYLITSLITFPKIYSDHSAGLVIASACTQAYTSSSLSCLLLFQCVAIQCPSGMVYQQCGPLCVRTCDNIGEDCPGGCAEGCFCPDGLVTLNGRCIDPIACPG